MQAYHLLLEPAAYKSLADLVQDTIADSLIVSFCIHAKNLMEFFSRDTSKEYAAAADYAHNYQPWQIAHGSRAHELKGKINNQLSHLTFERTADGEEKIGAPDRKELVEMIHDELLRWKSCLKPTYDAMKLNVEALAIAKGLPISKSSTGHTGPGPPTHTTHTTTTIRSIFDDDLK